MVAAFLGAAAAVGPWPAAAEEPAAPLPPPPALDLPPPAPPVEPPAAPPALPSSTDPPPPAPVVAGEPMPKRAMQLNISFGSVFPEPASSLLAGGSRPYPSLGLAMEYRFSRFAAFTLELGEEWRHYPPDNMPPGGFLASASGVQIDIASLGAGVRVFWAGGAVEPWGGAMLLLVNTRLENQYTVLGLPGWTNSAAPGGSDTSPTLELQAGLRFYPGGHWTLGLEASRRSSSASFDPFPGTVQLGGWGTRLSLGYLFY
jgi:hypothetical protein